MSKQKSKYDSLEPLERLSEYCEAMIEFGIPPSDDDTASDEHQGREPRRWYKGPCTREIKTMAYKGTGACGEIHRKLMAGESHGDLKPQNPTGEC